MFGLEEPGEYFNAFVFPAALLVNRILISYAVRRSMSAKSDEVQSEWPEIVSRDELEAKATPRIVERRASDDRPTRKAVRKQMLAPATSRMRTRLAHVLLVAATLAFLPGWLASAFGQHIEHDASMHQVVAVLWVLLAVVSYVYMRTEGSARWHARGWRHPYQMIAGWLLSPQADPFWAPFLFLMITDQGDGASGPSPLGTNAPTPYAYGVLTAFVLYLGLWVLRWRRAPVEPNTKLLVLRVFQSGGANSFVFERLVRVWRNFGTHLTIDDPGYAARRARFFQSSTVLKLLVVGIPASAGGLEFAAFALFCFCVVDWVSLVLRRPLASVEQIKSQIVKVLERPITIDGFFRDLRMICYSNTWRLAVAEFVQVADAILMDLRAVGEDNEGCKYEVDFIFDTFSVEKIVFLCGPTKEECARVHSLLLERYKKLRDGSPNEKLKNPIIQVYVCSEESAAEVDALAETVYAAAHPDVLQRGAKDALTPLVPDAERGPLRETASAATEP